MSDLIHLIYSSAATVAFSKDDLLELLAKARNKNEGLGITGMLLYDNGSFFQVLEGHKHDVDTLYSMIEKDPRHESVVKIIEEPIFKRSFEEWRMAYAAVTTDEIADIIGLSDFYQEGTTFGGISNGRAKKLLSAFKGGRWHSRLKNTAVSSAQSLPERVVSRDIDQLPLINHYQPIYDANDDSLFAYEVLAHDSASGQFISDDKLSSMIDSLAVAKKFYACQIQAAAKHNSTHAYTINFFGKDLASSQELMEEIIATIDAVGMSPQQFVIEIHQSQMIASPQAFGGLLQQYRSSGLRFLIDHFGAGRAGLNLLEPYRPDMIAINQFLVAGIHNNGPRQAILRGLLQASHDLAIDVVAKFVNDADEYVWLKDAGVDFVQGDLFSAP